MRTFLALLRLFVWMISLSMVGTSIFAYFDQIQYQDDSPAKTAYAAQALVWIFSAYFAGQAFDLTTRSLEELCNRFRRRRS